MKINVKVLPNEQDWEFVFGKRWHMVNGRLHSPCDCIVMAVF